MLNNVNHATAKAPPSPLSPDDWLNAMWITTRVMSILAHPPVIMGFEAEGTPEIVWIDPDDDWVACVLAYSIDPATPPTGTLCLHISDNISEGGKLALIGLCTLRGAQWDIIPADMSEDDADEIPTTADVAGETDSDTKPGS